MLCLCSFSTTSKAEDLSDEEVIAQAMEELQRLADKIESLEEVIEDAEDYGEEPYNWTDDGEYMTGNEAVEACENTIENSVNDALEILDGLSEYYNENPEFAI